MLSPALIQRLRQVASCAETPFAAETCRMVLDRIEEGQPVHSDDLAVDNFAVAMKAKLGTKRAEGRGGWDDPDACNAAYLSLLLVEHIGKGDPLDVGNLAMMLHQRGERIAGEREQYAEARRRKNAR